MRPFLGHPFPKRWAVFGAAINAPRLAGYWQDTALRWTRGKNCDFDLPCDLSVFSGRIAWFFRRWYEIDTQSVIATLLPRGGTFIDIGANIGMATLSAASAVGPEGKIIAFEPNPAVADIFRRSMRRNGLESIVELHNAAIADTDGTMPMFVPSSNHGESSLAGGSEGREGKSIDVTTTTAAFLLELPRIDLVKIDVEGFELHVLKTLRSTLERFRPPVISEVMDEHLSRAGTTSQDLRDCMADIGYLPFGIGIENHGLFCQRAQLLPVTLSGGDISCNVLWLHESQIDQVLATSFVSLRK